MRHSGDTVNFVKLFFFAVFADIVAYVKILQLKFLLATIVHILPAGKNGIVKFIQRKLCRQLL